MLWQGNELTYCLNVHPGESLASVRTALEGPVKEVKERVCRDTPFGLGLRLSARAVQELVAPGKVAELRRNLDEWGMYAFTVNGFPYGTFHGASVKDRVYLPDWSTPQRYAYTQALARVMAQLVGAGKRATISTVPLGYRLHGDTEERRAACAHALLRQISELWRLEQDSGVQVALALEPEPHCLLETSDDVVEFFSRHVFTAEALATIGRTCGTGRGEAASIVRRHLGVCLDTCHGAVEFEDPETLLYRLEQANIAIHKVQISSGLRIPYANDEARRQLQTFDEPVYLHQVVAQGEDGKLRRYTDISEALADPAAREQEWRVHFHVPVHESRLAVFDSTQSFTAEVLRLQRERSFCEQWEIETYTWHVLPTKATSLVDSICAEYAWVQGQL